MSTESSSCIVNVNVIEPAKLLDQSCAEQSNKMSFLKNLKTCNSSEVVGAAQDFSDVKLSSHFNQEDLHGPDNDMDTSYNIDSVDLTDTHGEDDILLDHNSSLQELLSNSSPGKVS